MAKNTVQKARAARSDAATAARVASSQKSAEDRAEANAPVRAARDVRREAQEEQMLDSRKELIDQAAAEAEADANPKRAGKPTLLDGKPGSGSGLKPGDLFAPKSNPGAAARVPFQPLQPESLQSHGKGIIYDKDIDNPPYDTGDPVATDAGPAGSNPDVVDKEAESYKAEKATSRYKQLDPDNPAIGAGGRKDATASPNPIGSRSRSKNSVAGGSNSGDSQ